MSVRATVALLKENPKMTKAQADKKLGYRLPQDFWEMAKKVALVKKSPVKNKVRPIPKGHPREGLERIIKKIGSNSSERDKCVAILKENISSSREEIGIILGELPKKDTFRRAQILAGGVSTYQKTIIKEILYTGEKMVSGGRDPFSMQDKDVVDAVGHNESCKYRGLIVNSDMFKQTFHEEFEGRKNPLLRSFLDKKVVSKKSSGCGKLLAKIMVPEDSCSEFDVKLVKRGANRFLEIRNKG